MGKSAHLEKKISVIVRQGCVLSPDLFSLYNETIMRNLDGYPGIKVGGHNVNNFRYADDSELIAENKELLDILDEESRKKGLELNSKKTEVMVDSRNNKRQQIDIFINRNKFKQRNQFKYFATLISNDGCNSTEIASRIAKAKKKKRVFRERNEK